MKNIQGIDCISSFSEDTFQDIMNGYSVRGTLLHAASTTISKSTRYSGAFQFNSYNIFQTEVYISFAH